MMRELAAAVSETGSKTGLFIGDGAPPVLRGIVAVQKFLSAAGRKAVFIDLSAAATGTRTEREDAVRAAGEALSADAGKVMVISSSAVPFSAVPTSLLIAVRDVLERTGVTVVVLAGSEVWESGGPIFRSMTEKVELIGMTAAPDTVLPPAALYQDVGEEAVRHGM